MKQAAKVAGVLLAAGAGKRYGKPKVLAEGGAWLRSGVEALRVGGCSPIYVALGAAEATLPAPASPIWVPQWERGIGVTLRTCLERLVTVPGIGGAVIHLVDIPDISGAQVSRLLDAVRGRTAIAARACFAGVHGHPVYLGVDLFEQVCAEVGGDRGAGRFLSEFPGLVLVECGDLGSGEDRDTPRVHL